MRDAIFRSGTCSPKDASDLCAQGVCLLDVREPHEQALGMPLGARSAPRAQLLADPSRWLPDRSAPVLLICARGVRSADCRDRLRAAGYGQVASVEGGYQAWRTQGLALTAAAADADFYQRYARHLQLSEIGLEGQRRLQAARVLLVGAGGLGSPAGYYLAAAGVGRIDVIDDDLIERSNLQRQILHRDADLGIGKAVSARQALLALNPAIEVHAIEARLSVDNVDTLVAPVDVVLDGADNFATRYLLSDACLKHGKPMVYGAVHRFEGQVSIFDAGRRRGQSPCYRCLFPEPPPPQFAPNCTEAGVLGVLPGLIGLIQASETIKLLLGLGDSLSGRLLQVDVLRMRFRETRLNPDPNCAWCAPGRVFPGYLDYGSFCTG